MSSVRKTLSLLTALLLSAALAHGLEAAGELRGEVDWQGEVLLAQTVTVAPLAVLTIAPGTVVRPQSPGTKLIVKGVLKVRGSAEQPVTFAAPEGWQGIEFVDGAEGSLLEHAVFSKALIAVSSVATGFSMRHCTIRDGARGVKLLREASPLIEENLFVGNDIGIDSEMKSAAVILRNRFLEHQTTAILLAHNSVGLIEGNRFEKNRQGIGVLQKYSDRISGNHFVDNEVGIYCNQTQGTPHISKNKFEGNRSALSNYSFASPVVEDNTFTGNELGIRNDQFGSPRVVRNIFRGNRTAVYNYRKSNPVIELNLIEQNELAIFCDYSSYPNVHQNNFRSNGMGVKLGIYQSGDWERQHGSKGTMQKEAAIRQGRNSLMNTAPAEVKDIIDVSNNWWGDDTAKFQSAGVAGNLEMFHDRHDQPRVFYDGFAAEGYDLDVIRFDPWLTAPVMVSNPGR